MFYKEKGWYKSKTVWAGILTMTLAFLGMLGITPEINASEAVNAVFAALAALGIYGRVKADTFIVSKE